MAVASRIGNVQLIGALPAAAGGVVDVRRSDRLSVSGAWDGQRERKMRPPATINAFMQEYAAHHAIAVMLQVDMAERCCGMREFVDWRQ